MVRLLAACEFDGAWAGIEQLHTEAGIPLPADERERVTGWLAHNPGLLHLCEDEGRRAGYASLIPVYRESFERRVRGGAGPAVTTDEILTGPEYAAARWEGVWVWIERFVAATVGARKELGERVYHALGRMHLRGLMVTTADAQGEADCRWLGLAERCSPPHTPADGQKLWYADERSVAPTPDEPFGPPTPVRCLFLMVRERFGRPPVSLQLTPTERRVARLFYGEDREADQIARALGMQPGTVKTHLQRIRRKAEPIVGSRLSRRIGAYLAEHPGEMIERLPD